MSLLLAVDVGNTNIVLGIFDLDGGDDSPLLHSWRIATTRERTADEYGLMFGELFRHQGKELSMVSEMVIGSVVPPLHPVLETCCQKYLNVSPLWVEPGIRTGLDVMVDNPNEVGADRIANCVGALEIYGAPSIVVDLGTATTFDVINDRREYLGGMILPGVKISAEVLFQRASRLPRVEIAKPENLVGSNTIQAMQSGLYYGCIGQIDGILERLLRQFPSTAVLATGGLAKIIGAESKYVKNVEPYLTLIGLRTIWRLNRKLM